MSSQYYISKSFEGRDFDAVIDAVKAALKLEGFGVLTDIDVQATMKEKLGADFRRYRILGACNPLLAKQALETEDKIGTMLPCNVIVQEKSDGDVEIAAINPMVAMSSVDNPALAELAKEVTLRLQRVVSKM